MMSLRFWLPAVLAAALPLGCSSDSGTSPGASTTGDPMGDTSMNGNDSMGGSSSMVMTPSDSQGGVATAEGGAPTMTGQPAGGAPPAGGNAMGPDLVVPPDTLGDVTWYQDIAPLAAAKCGGCHRDGGIAPFSMDTYEQAFPLAALMANSVTSRVMPPWGALDTDECDVQHPWKNDARLSDTEVSLFQRWVDLGAPEGDPDTAAPLPARPDLVLQDANLNLGIQASVSVSGTNDQFLCFSLDPQLAEDVWITGLQVNPGNSNIVHHVLVFPDPDGATADLAGPDGSYPCNGASGTNSPTLLGAWAPGSVPAEPPDGVGMKLTAGSRILLNVHYHPTGAGTETDDSTSIDLRFTTTQPEYEGVILLLGNQLGLSTAPFDIPAGATDHEEGNSITLVPGYNRLLGIGSTELYVWAAGTHMHYLGVDMKIDVTRAIPAAGELPDECLVQTPQWDFNWQRAYAYDAPLSEVPRLSVGDTITLRCRYDNSLDNPNVRLALDEQGLSEPVDVVLGENTLDEMCLGVFGVAYPAE